MAHNYLGGGVPVTLAEIGHLKEIVEQYAYLDAEEGAFRRLSDQIADTARKGGAGAISYSFDFHYDFGEVEFSHGQSVVGGTFSGSVAQHGNMFRIDGRSMFHFIDRFEDPVGMEIEIGGTPYAISIDWYATFAAEILVDPANSRFTVG